MMRQLSKYLKVFALVVALMPACAASTRTYQRAGTAAAVLALTGAVLTPVGNPGISRTNERAGMAVAGVGAATQLAGLLIGLWALDGLILQSAPPSMFD
jgi:hypothetical protein